MNGHFLILQRILVALFPSLRAYLNFLMIVTWLFVMSIAIDEKTIVVLAALGAIYSLNEWVKEAKKE